MTRNRRVFQELMDRSIRARTFFAAIVVSKSGVTHTITADFLHKGEWEYRVNSEVVTRELVNEILDASDQC